MRNKILLALLGLILCGSVQGMIQTLSLEELVAGSDLIVIASLKSSQEQGKTAEGLTQVENLLLVDSAFKGEIKAGSELKVSTIGGFEDEVVFAPRQKGVLFLKKNEAGGFEVNNLVQGWWPLGRDGAPAGMGTGVTLEKLQEVIKAVAAGDAPVPSTAPPGDQL